MRSIPSGRGFSVASQMLTVVKNGLVLNVDAGDTNSYPGTGVTWSDRSTVASNFTLTNGPTFNTTTSANITFDGVDDHALNTANATQQALSNQSDFSIDIWFKLNVPTVSGTRCICANGTTVAGAANCGIALSMVVVASTSATIRLPITTTTAVSAGSASSAFPVGNFTGYTHLVATYQYNNGSSQSVYSYYRNNVLDSTTATSQPANMANSSSAFFIARRPSGTLQYAPISVAALKIYNKVLSTSEIAQNYNALRGRFGL